MQTKNQESSDNSLRNAVRIVFAVWLVVVTGVGVELLVGPKPSLGLLTRAE